jgi:pSer/pThr/pTyr-binding forkhead associated (FHA) protein
MAKLVVISDEMKDRTFELAEEHVTVGRLKDNSICLDDGAISSHHAELTRKGEDYVVRDLNSTNGTRVNGQRVVETRLYHGDGVAFGHLQLQYFSSSKSAPQPLPSPLKKTVDLSSIAPGTTSRPATYGSSSPFTKQQKSDNKSKTVFTITVIILVVLAVVLLALFVNKLFAT